MAAGDVAADPSATNDVFELVVQLGPKAVDVAVIRKVLILFLNFETTETRKVFGFIAKNIGAIRAKIARSTRRSLRSWRASCVLRASKCVSRQRSSSCRLSRVPRSIVRTRFARCWRWAWRRSGAVGGLAQFLRAALDGDRVIVVLNGLRLAGALASTTAGAPA